MVIVPFHKFFAPRDYILHTFLGIFAQRNVMSTEMSLVGAPPGNVNAPLLDALDSTFQNFIDLLSCPGSNPVLSARLEYERSALSRDERAIIAKAAAGTSKVNDFNKKFTLFAEFIRGGSLPKVCFERKQNTDLQEFQRLIAPFAPSKRSTCTIS